MDDIRNAVDQTIMVKGHVSNIQWQHMIRYDKENPIISYVDLDDGFQIVVYSKGKLPNKESILIKGKIIKISGPSKRPGETKVDDTYSEYQMIVEDILNHT